MLIIGFFGSNFLYNYKHSFELGLLLGVVLIINGLARWFRSIGYLVLVVLALVNPFFSLFYKEQARQVTAFQTNIQMASEALMNGEVKNVIFLWDSPTAHVVMPKLLDPVGDFFFQRVHDPVVASRVVVPSGQDPNRRLLAIAKQMYVATV